jgi:hypothetical protein
MDLGEEGRRAALVPGAAEGHAILRFGLGWCGRLGPHASDECEGDVRRSQGGGRLRRGAVGKERTLGGRALESRTRRFVLSSDHAHRAMVLAILTATRRQLGIRVSTKCRNRQRKAVQCQQQNRETTLHCLDRTTIVDAFTGWQGLARYNRAHGVARVTVGR